MLQLLKEQRMLTTSLRPFSEKGVYVLVTADGLKFDDSAQGNYIAIVLLWLTLL